MHLLHHTRSVTWYEPMAYLSPIPCYCFDLITYIYCGDVDASPLPLLCTLSVLTSVLVLVASGVTWEDSCVSNVVLSKISVAPTQAFRCLKNGALYDLHSESSIELQTNAYVCTGWTKASNILDYSRYHILLLINSSEMRRYSLLRHHRPNPAIMNRSVLLYSNYQAYAPCKIHPSFTVMSLRTQA